MRTTVQAWWQRTAVALLLTAACLPLAARGIAGPRGAEVNVRWQPAVDAPARQAIEQKYGLRHARLLDDTTWRYTLIDPSSDNIRGIVQNPAIADTHELDRQAFEVSPTAARTGRQLRFDAGDTLVTAADRSALVLMALAAVLALLGVSGLAATPRAAVSSVVRPVRAMQTAVARVSGPPLHWLQRGIPEIDATTAGLFRIVFGLALLAFCVGKRVDASWLSATFDLEVEGQFHADVLDWLRQRPAVVNLLTPWLLVTCVAFTAGIFTRTSYGFFVAGMLVWAYVAESLDSTHPLGTIMLALVALLPSRWGDGLSVDAWRRSAGRHLDAIGPRRGTRPMHEASYGRQYGYSVWIPGLAFGVGMAAAAWAKILQGPDWILNGTIKYFFVTDSVIAPFDWGLQLAAYPRLAILASAGAMAIEGLAITAAFVRNDIYRLVIGIGAVGLLGGFWVFMGHFWPGWWILLLGFLPWARLGRRGHVPDVEAGFAPSPSAMTRPSEGQRAKADSRLHGVTAAQLALIVFVLVQQIVMSTLKIERAPMFSHYPMYSGTYDSPEEYNARRPPRYQMLATTDKGVVTLPCNPHEEFVRSFQSALKGSLDAKATVWEALRSCTGGMPVRAVRLEGNVEAFDWERLEFRSTPVPVLGPLTP